MSKEELKQIRESMGLTQKEFAVKLGVRIWSIRDWEQGRHRTPESVLKLARILKGAE